MAQKKTQPDKGFAPGLIYILYGECHKINYHKVTSPVNGVVYTDTYTTIDKAYKIGFSVHGPESRMKSRREWRYRENLVPVHSFPVDNMRVVEYMLHLRYKERRVHDEWFKIEDKLMGLCAIAEIQVEGVLWSYATHSRLEEWWHSIGTQRRRGLVSTFWKDPRLCIRYSRS